MATDIVGSLFGVSPEMYQEERNRQGMRDAIAMAQLDPMQYANAAIQAGAGRAAGGFAGLMGVEDPQMRLISIRNSLAKQFDTNTPQGLLEYSNALQDAGDVQGAALAADRVRSIQGALIKQQADLATTAETRARTGGLNVKAMDRTATINQLMTKFQLGEDEASTVASNPDLVKQYLSPKTAQGLDLLKTGRFTPESVAKWSTDKGTLELVDMTTKPSEDWLKTARGLGFDAKKSFNDYTPAQVAAVNKLEFQNQLNLRAAGASKTTVDIKQEQAVSKNKTDLAGEIEKDAFTAADRISLAQNLRTLLPKAFVGIGADVTLQGARVAEAFGIDIKGVAPSQIVDTILNEMTIGKAGELKGALSDKDREFLKATIGTRGLSIKTLNYVADEIERRASIDRNLNTRVNNFIKSKKSLNEIDFAEERAQAGRDVQRDLDRLKELRLKKGQP
jgi:hypothetical protein